MPQSSGSKALAITSLVVRLLTLIFLLASLIVIATDSATMKIDFTEVKIRFKNVYSYRYMVSVAVIGLAYTFLQIPFAVHYACTGKRLGAHDGLLKFEFFGDKLAIRDQNRNPLTSSYFQGNIISVSNRSWCSIWCHFRSEEELG
ncbi:CASP-like protein 4D1 isoform X1 [Vitis riparia]|uniref:CASP-like protein 4D1 isoform X1 n=1 Tax=Vitis riparia TaxID=96939 RepID=UPI00155A983C|nr:CASP-like protein 4D1 isoform X1 [Vitis riparia]